MTLSVKLFTIIFSLVTLSFLGLKWQFPTLTIPKLTTKITLPSLFNKPTPTTIPNYNFPITQQNLPRKTNSWFSSVYDYFPTQALFALPGIYQITDQGLRIGTIAANPSPNAIISGFNADCVIKFSQPLTKPTVFAYGDWHLVLKLEPLPNTYIILTQGRPTIDIYSPQTPQVTCDNATNSVTAGLYSKNNHHYLYETPSDPQSKHYRFSLLPNANTETINYFRNQPYTFLTDTQVSWKTNNKQITTTYRFITNNNAELLTTMWPHHLPYLSTQQVDLGSYTTPSGPLQLVKSSSFTTTHNIPAMPLKFTAVNNPQAKQQIIAAIREDLNTYAKATPPEGVYFRGTWLGALTTLVQLTDLYSLPEHQQALNLLEQHLLASLPLFKYDPKLQLLAYEYPEFDSHTGNDHHLQYGYYLRAAAVLASHRPQLISQLRAQTDQIALDLANLTNEKYPRLRTYSVYEGHSWADGDAGFGDGNNQESTSEALNAWYGLKIWGEASQNTSMADLGVWLFTQELAGTRAYWFGANNPFPAGYNHPMASIVWSGKRDFATWFSGQPLHIYGIQWLPITPASTYLKTLPNYEQHINELKAGDNQTSGHEWGDLYLAYLSYHNPTAAEQQLSQGTSTNGLKIKSLLLQTVYSNLQ